MCLVCVSTVFRRVVWSSVDWKLEFVGVRQQQEAVEEVFVSCGTKCPAPEADLRRHMLMFRSRRNALIKRLWKARLGGSDEEGREIRKWLLRRLTEDQLDTLAAAIESRGGGSADCVLVDQLEECPSPELLCCQVWRWPDLHSTRQLKKLPMCKSGVLAGSNCCNPYHWSRLCQAGMFFLSIFFHIIVLTKKNCFLNSYLSVWACVYIWWKLIAETEPRGRSRRVSGASPAEVTCC